MTVHTGITTAPGAAQLAESLLARIAARPEGRIVGSEGALSFAEVLRRVDELSSALGGCDRPVAICAAKHPDAIAGVLGALAAGRAYAPIDPSHPDARILAILDVLSPGAVLVDAPASRRLANWARSSGAPLIRLDSVSGGRRRSAARGELAAILHTSGSTGIPKQVRIGARAIEVFAAWVQEEFGLCPDDRVLSHAPLAFDLSFLDIFAALHAGAEIVLADAAAAQSGEKLVNIIADECVTFLHGAPSAFALITAAAADRVFPGVRAVLFAGEPMPADVLARIFSTFPEARIVNIYGCTETNDTFFYEAPRKGAPHPLPLGRPLPYTEHVILSDAGLPVGEGEDGELWVRCPTTMEGYADPVANAAAFATHRGQRYYRTRDRVRLGEDGLVHFLGRVDSVVKIRGNRIDMGEVEACLSGYPGVAEAAAFVTGADGQAQLEAALSLDGDDGSVNALSLRQHAMKTLPPFAIPRRFDLSREPLPRNSNGKICRRMLAARAESASDSVSIKP